MLKVFHVRTEAVGYMEEDVLEEGVDNIPVWKEEEEVKEVLKEYHELT